MSEEETDRVFPMRPIDQRRLDQLRTRTETGLVAQDIWYIHTVLAQCFLPYKDQKDQRDWVKKNGAYSLILTSGVVHAPRHPQEVVQVGLPFGAKPRLFQSYVNTQAVKRQSPVIPVERSMTAMMQVLGYEARGGPRGTIASFKDQITRFACCNFTIVAPGPRGTERYIKAPPIKQFDVCFLADADHGTLWPTEMVLTDEYYSSLKDHAVPFDFRALQAIQNKPRAQDIYLWMTQRLCRLHSNKPLLLRWQDLYEMFGGDSPLKAFKRDFPTDLLAAGCSYPDARITEHREGYLFHASHPPVPKTKVTVKKQARALGSHQA